MSVPNIDISGYLRHASWFLSVYKKEWAELRSQTLTLYDVLIFFFSLLICISLSSHKIECLHFTGTWWYRGQLLLSSRRMYCSFKYVEFFFFFHLIESKVFSLVWFGLV